MNTLQTKLPHDHMQPKPPHADHDLRPWLGSASVVLALLALAACAYAPIAMASLPLAAAALGMGLMDMKKSFRRKGPWLALAVLGCLLSVGAFVAAARVGSAAGRANDEALSMHSTTVTAPARDAK